MQKQDYKTLMDLLVIIYIDRMLLSVYYYLSIDYTKRDQNKCGQEWRGFHWTLLTHSRRGTNSVGSRCYNHTHFRNYFTNCRTYQLYWRSCWNCPPLLPIHFWHLFIKFSINRCSSLLMLISLPEICYTEYGLLNVMEFLHPGIVLQRVFVLGRQTELTNIDHK